MPTPFPFVANSVLTAAQLNSISELPTRTLTGSAAAVAADSYSRVILNGTSITYTINTSTFSAGQVVELYNANSTAATIAAGAGVTLNGAAGLTLAQYQTAELYAISATSFVLWKSDVTQSSGALVLTKSQTIGSGVSSVAVTNAFSATYDNYKILISGGAASTNNWLGLQIGNATSGYYWGRAGCSYTSQTFAGDFGNNTASFGFINYTGGANGLVFSCEVLGPFLSKNTGAAWHNVMYATGQAGGAGSGFLNNTTSYTDFTITVSSGTLTGGEIRVYGYAMS